MKKATRWLILLASSFLLSNFAFSGPVGVASGFPDASMNAKGDFILAGNLKVLSRMQSRFSGHAFKVPKVETIPSYSHVNLSSAGIVCGHQEPLLLDGLTYSPIQFSFKPNERFRVCSRLQDGGFVMVSKHRVLYRLGKEAIQEIPLRVNLRPRAITRIDAIWVIFDESGQIWQMDFHHKKLRKSKTKLPVLDPYDAIKTRNNRVLIAGFYQTYLYLFNHRNNEIVITKKINLPVNPCEEFQRCGVSLADDGSWIISGFWGAYLGLETNFTRLKLSILPEKYGGTAIAHSSLEGKFVFASNLDGDFGALKDVIVSPIAVSQNEIKSLEHKYSDKVFVWSKSPIDSGSFKIPMEHKGLPEVFLSILGKAMVKSIPSDQVIATEKAVYYQIPKFTRKPYSGFDISNQWWTKDIKAKEAFERISDIAFLSNINVAVIDTGVNKEHFLLSHIDFSESEQHFDFVREDSDPNDENGHGTHVSALIVGKDGNKVLGAGQNVNLMILKAFDRGGVSNSIDLARALIFADQNQAEIINCSWGGGPNSLALSDVFAVLKQNQRIIISSSGNDGLDISEEQPVPVVYEGVWSVGAHDKNGKRAQFSNFSKSIVHFSAPGKDIVSAGIESRLEEMSGTSMSAGVFSGGAALVLGLLKSERHPNREKYDTNKEILKEALCQHSQKNITDWTRCGKLDLDQAVRNLLSGNIGSSGS